MAKKQQLLSKHRATTYGKNSQKTEERGAFDEHHPHLMKRHVEQFQIHRETQLHKAYYQEACNIQMQSKN